MILYFLKKHFDDKEKLIIPMKPLEMETDPQELDALFSGKSFKEDYKILNGEIRKLGYNIPPLVNAYMSLSPTMKLFGTAINYGFGDVEGTPGYVSALYHTCRRYKYGKNVSWIYETCGSEYRYLCCTSSFTYT